MKEEKSVYFIYAVKVALYIIYAHAGFNVKNLLRENNTFITTLLWTRTRVLIKNGGLQRGGRGVKPCIFRITHAYIL